MTSSPRSRPGVLLLAGIALVTTAPAADPAAPTRDAFLREVLDAKPTAATPKFDDFTEGSYHVNKADLLRGLVDEAKRQKRTLRGVAVHGPSGPLWGYHVTAFVQEGDKVRVNSVAFPHARITGKATGVVAAGQFDKWVDGLVETGVPQKDVPAGAIDPKAKDGPPLDHRFDLLLAVWDAKGGSARTYYASEVGGHKRADDFEKRYNTILAGMTETYPGKGD